MAEPSLAGSQRTGRLFSRSRLRDAIGPSNPLYEFHQDNCIQDVVSFEDDFLGDALNVRWTPGTTGGTLAVVPAITAGGLGGLLDFEPGTDDNDDSTLAGSLQFAYNRRPVLLGRIFLADITSCKFEFGFTDVETDQGAVDIKATPTSTATDYAVIVRDTDDDTSTDLHADGGTDAVESVASSPGQAFVNDAFVTLMIAGNENKETYFWLNGVFQGKAVRGPDITVALLPWVSVENRTNTSHNMTLDYIKGWQERNTAV